MVDGTQLTAPAEAKLIGAYRLVRQIGEGGMGAVWLAEHTMLGRRAAIKVLHPMFRGREDIVTRFFNEARAATAISDPGIVQVFDFGHHTDGSAYIVMELLDGEPLERRLHRHGALSVGDALRILRQVASALGAAHARGIVHRDLKPENIFLVRDPEVPGGERAKILDFGIAKLAGDHVGVKTQTSAVMGTPVYMSPEQCRGAGGVDQRSDVYALGCVLLALVTGRPPFDAAGSGDIIAMHLREPAPRASSRVPSVPPAVDELIARCLDKDPSRRFGSGTELAAAIGAITVPQSTPVLSAFANLDHRAIAVSTTLSGSALSMVATMKPRRRRGVAIGGALVLVAAGLVTWMATRETSSAAPALSANRDTPVSVPASKPPGPTSPTAPATAAANASVPVATAVRDDKPDAAKAHIKQVLHAFVQWAPKHAGAPCPSTRDLAGVLGGARTLEDPWGVAVTITCTDQPADQIIGVISAGPDRATGTRDDLSSWTLGQACTEVVHGSRWTPARKSPTRTESSTRATVAKPDPPAASTPPKPAIELGADGMPAARR